MQDSKKEDDYVIKAVEKVFPSVVAISTVHESFTSPALKGMGSGIIVHPEGYIATNYHVIEGSEEVEVILSDGSRIQGEVVGIDPSSDLAVIKMARKGLNAVDLGDSDEIKVGQTVIAIGSAFGFFLNGPTVTKGVVSAVHRNVRLEDDILEDFIQTDAAINPGNSGGPLVDLDGKVIGITTAMIPFAQGIGFAIPSNTVRKVLEDLIIYGKVSRSWLGIEGITIEPNMAMRYGLAVSRGVGVAGVARGGPAYRGGVEPGDTRTKIDGRDVDDVIELRRQIRTKKPGQTIVLEIVRNGKRYNAKVPLAAS
ncbi:MAG: trypsin-like peptidase domain-containing protein [Conexivisphaerales archaeon]